MKKKILFFSGSRAEYYIQSPILMKFQKNKNFKTFFVISGSHTSNSFGKTLGLIKKDNIKIYSKIDLHITSNKNNGLARLTLGLKIK